MPLSSGAVQFEQTFAINPIFLVGGIAGTSPGATVPLLSYLQGSNFATLFSQGDPSFDLDDSYAYFEPIPGSTLIANQLGAYPFANIATAANAIITQPLNISLAMIAPARQAGDYFNKLAVTTNLQNALAQHVLAGGTFTVATPAFMYQNAILIRLSDISGGETHQKQWRWQWDFQIPLVSLADATAAYNTQMGRIANGTQVTANANGEVTWSGQQNSPGTAAAGTGNAVPAGQTNPASIQSGPGPTQIPLGFGDLQQP